MDDSRIGKPSGLRRKASLNITFCVKKEKSSNYKKVYAILQKSESDRTAEENETLENSAAAVKEAAVRLEKRRRLKSRSEEIEDQPSVLAEKCRLLAGALLNAQHLVVYSGAGVSTAARIPDYRGTNGIWTRLQQGKDIGCHDLSQAEPTLTHMALFALYRCGKLKHVVSQNCDGLHLRSGIPRAALSEVHGNMYLEVCTPCKVEYWRLFDVTEHTGRYCHETARLCFYCRKPLRDTIVHFGERGALRWPLNWKGACDNADKADIILCIGSSLKVLKRYPWLWCMDKPVKKRPMLFIVNLQWTPKDDQATLKINGKCDEVMSLVMSHLGMSVPKYIRELDPIFAHATMLDEVELHTTSQPILQLIIKQEVKVEVKGDKKNEDEVVSDKNNDISVKSNDFNSSTSILITDETDGSICDLKLDLVEEEVIITTTIENENENDCEIIECVKMEIDDVGELDDVVESSDTIQTIKDESNSNITLDVDKKLIKKNDCDGSDNNHVSDVNLKETINELWRPFNDSFVNKSINHSSSSSNHFNICSSSSSSSSKSNKYDIEATSSKSNKISSTNKTGTSSINGISSLSGINLNVSSTFRLENYNSNADGINKSKVILINDAAGFSVPLEEFDKMYCKIGKGLALNNSGAFYQEFLAKENSCKQKSVSFTRPAAVCNLLPSVKLVNCTKVNDNNLSSRDQLKKASTKFSQGNFNINKKNNSSINTKSNLSNVSSNINNYTFCDIDKKNYTFDADSFQTQPLDLSLVKSSCKDIVKFDINNKPSDRCSNSSLFCQFCSDNYNCNTCQFYKRLIPIIPDTGPFCYCCDDDDSDNDNPAEKAEQSSDYKNTADKKAPVDGPTNKVPIVNPGWFGKGYRKRNKKKR